jgi:uncharacterized membrane protein (DUF441 family)
VGADPAARTGWPRRYRSTLVLVSALVASALITGTVLGGLSNRMLDLVGFAPIDLWEMDVLRVFTSALVTHGGLVFVAAVVMTALSVGGVERRMGSLAAMGVFWGVHVWTLLVMAAVLPVIEGEAARPLVETLSTLRDVGPSAGYFGCLGFALAATSFRARGVAAAVVLAWLLGDVGGWLSGAGPLPPELSADIAHLIAFPTGWVAAMVAPAAMFAEDPPNRSAAA